MCVCVCVCVCVFEYVCVYHPTDRNKCWVTTVFKNGLEIEHYLGLGKHALIHLSICPSNSFEPLTGDKDYGMKQSFSKRI